jgi:hypothetical protein
MKPAELVNAIHAIAREIAEWYELPIEEVMLLPVAAFIKLRLNLPRWT